VGRSVHRWFSVPAAREGRAARRLTELPQRSLRATCRGRFPDRGSALPAVRWAVRPVLFVSRLECAATSPIPSPTPAAELSHLRLAAARAADLGRHGPLLNPLRPHPSPTVGTPPAWLRHLVLNPGGTLSRWGHHLLHTIAHAAAAFAPGLVPLAGLAVGVGLAGWVGVGLLFRWRAARSRRRGCWLEIGVPADVYPSGGEVLWRAVAVALRRGWRAALTPHPSVSFNLVASAVGVRIGLRLPGGVNPGAFVRTVAAAWPGVTANVEQAGPHLPRGLTAAGGQLRPARAEWLPLTGENRRGGPDPLRGVLGQLVELAPGQLAVLAVSARLARRRRITRGHVATGIRPQTHPWRPVHWLLDVLEGLLSGGRTRRTRTTARPDTDPMRTADMRAGLAKLTDTPLWEVSVSYAVATTASGFAARRACRATAAGIAMGLGVYPGLTSRRLARPVQALTTGRAGSAFLASTGELAALAHLPVDAAVTGLVRAGARPVAPPGQLSVPTPRWPADDEPENLDRHPTGRAVLPRQAGRWPESPGEDSRWAGGDPASWVENAGA